jgi:hypothetical protein
VRPAGPTTDRPGSIEIRGTGVPTSAQTRATTSASVEAMRVGDGGTVSVPV